MSITTINPATGKVIATYAFMSERETNEKIARSYDAFLCWSKKSIVKRAENFMKAAAILLDNKVKYATLITTEMGKPLNSAKDEIEKCALACRHFASHAEAYLAPRLIKTEMSKSYAALMPLGVIFAIMPWNFPFWQVFRFAAPALMAGNSAILKHAPITTACGLAIENIFKLAGFPEDLFQTLILDNDLAEKVIVHDKVAAVTLTGSNQTGKTVAAISGGALKKIVLELGGNDPYIILEDADLVLAAEAIVASRMNNAGQSCIAAKRLLAVSSIREKFQELVLEKLASYKMGDPLDPAVRLGPLAREDLRKHLDDQVQASVKRGAKILRGGSIPDQPGFYYPPTVLVDVKKGMPAYDDELFGPVFTFIDVRDEKQAIDIANDTPFGLSAAVFTQNVKRGEQMALHEIRAGTVFVNDFVRSDPRLPFGGIKGSGFGRELSQEGIQEFVNIKTIGIH